MQQMKASTVTVNFIWRFLERCGAQGVSFIVSIILARLLAPEVFGVIALVTVFTTILQVFVDSGFGTALIQKLQAEELDFSTVFWFNVAMCVALYILLFFAAPWIAAFYEMPELVAIVRVLGLTLIISGVKNIQQAYISRNMLFKKFFFATLGGTIFSAILGIYMAYHGYGVWALVIQNLVNTLVHTIILWITVKWKPKFIFSVKRLKNLFSFGWKLLLSSLIDTVYNDLRQLIIGKMYSSSALAFYNKGKQFPNLIVTNVNTSIDSVLLPTMSKEQENKKIVKSITRRAIKMSTYIMAPLMMGLAFTANTVVELVLTKKWLPCVPFLVIFCVSYMFYPIHTANLNAIKAMGKSNVFLRLEIIKKIIGLVLLFASMWFGVLAMAYSMLLSTLFSQIVNSWPNKKILDYGYLEQLKDILPGILLAVFMGGCVWLAGRMLTLPSILILIIQVLLGAGIYIGLSALFRLESFSYLCQMLRQMVKRK